MLFPSPDIILNKTDTGVLLTLMYFDIFRYPLTESEIVKSVPVRCAPEELRVTLQKLVNQGLIFQAENFYHVSPEKEIAEKRKEENFRAEAIMPKARRISRFIGAFPYIRGVYLSGSLSKGVLTEKGDIDYFILTQPERLWLARTLLVVFRKLFLFNSHKYFCVNYFVDLNNLEIEDKNIFTATELFTLIPTYGKETYPLLITHNRWAESFYPQFPVREVTGVPENESGILKRTLELIGNTRIGEWLDTWCMRMTFRYRKKKFSGMTNTDFNVAFKTRKYISKHHPANFQKKVTDKLKEKILHFEEKHKLTVDSEVRSLWGV